MSSKVPPNDDPAGDAAIKEAQDARAQREHTREHTRDTWNPPATPAHESNRNLGMDAGMKDREVTRHPNGRDYHEDRNEDRNEDRGGWINRDRDRDRGREQPADQLEPIMHSFSYSHLPQHLQIISKPFADLAWQLSDNIPRNPERSVALLKLLEAKDAAVRAKIGTFF